MGFPVCLPHAYEPAIRVKAAKNLLFPGVHAFYYGFPLLQPYLSSTVNSKLTLDLKIV